MRSLIVGIDLNRKAPQICYYDRNTKDTQTAPMKSGNEDMSFQDILEKLDDLTESSTLSDEKRQSMMRDLETQGTELLMRTFMTLGIEQPGRQIDGIMVTAEVRTRPLVTLIQGVYHNLGIDREHAFIQDYRESMYYHTMYQ